MNRLKARKILKAYQKELDKEAKNRHHSGIERAVQLTSLPIKLQLSLATAIEAAIGTVDEPAPVVGAD